VNAAVLIPVKDFTQAKARLAGALSPADRALLARWMAERVVAAAGALPVFVVCDDEEVADWATSVHATVLWRPGHGLNGAATDGVAALAAEGFASAIVVHSDLPLAHDLAALPHDGAAVFVPDRHGDGTNAIAIPAASGFEFRYGARSFERHLAEAEALDLPVIVHRDARLGLDVDTPDDLRLAGEHLPPFARLAS
jgi:2-phospho-L-lactate guanylyltransferase